MNRRRFISLGAAAAAMQSRRPVILVKSGWQTVNIGDIAHTPGLLALLEKHVPAAEVILWPNEVDRGVEPMLQRRFPKLAIVQGGADTSAVQDAFRRANFFLHGSGPSIVGAAQIEAWRAATGKPYGIFGVTITVASEAASTAVNDKTRELLKNASFVYTRETVSLGNLKGLNLKGPEIAFAPDGTFSFDLEDESRALGYLRASQLEPKKFIAVIPRLRLTPYHKIRKVNWTAEEIERRTRINEQHAEADHAKARAAITAYVRRTGGKVLLCPEMTYELDIIDPLLYEPLPDDVKPNIVRRKTYWLPDEAASVYRRAAVVMSMECHSPILAAVQGTPCLYLHQREDGIKGQMWADVGLGDWKLDLDDVSAEQIVERLFAIVNQPDAAAGKVRTAVRSAQQIQADRMRTVARMIP